MTTGEVVIVFIIFICIGMIVHYMMLPKRKKCNVRMRQIKLRDPFGINITDNIVLLFLSTNLFSRKVERRYRCPKCGETEKKISRERDQM
jgi:hypothetical protein